MLYTQMGALRPWWPGCAAVFYIICPPGRSVIIVHGLLAAVFDDVLRGLNGSFKAFHQDLPLRLRGNADDPVDHLGTAPCRGTGADFDAGEILGTQVGDDVLDAVVTAGGAGGPHPQLAHGEGHVIVDHQHMVGGNFVELRSLMDGFAGEVHIGLGLHHQALLAPEADDVIGRFELHFVQFHVQLFRQQIHREKAHIVAGVLIFLAGIAQAHDEPVHRPAGFFKDHREFLLVCLYHIPKETGKQVCFPVFYITLNALIFGRIVTGTAWRWRPPDRYAQ